MHLTSFLLILLTTRYDKYIDRPKLTEQKNPQVSSEQLVEIKLVN